MNQDKQKSNFWNSFERFKSLIELIAALVVLAPIVFAGSGLIQQGLTAVVPAWLVFITTVFAILLGYLLGRRLNTPHLQGSDHQGETLLQKIEFDYQNTPTEHGWDISQEVGKISPTFNSISDGFVGSALEIRATDFYGMDIQVNPVAEIGTLIEFVVKVERGYGIYANLSLQSKDGSKLKNVWLNFQIGSTEPKPYGDGTWEWFVYVTPEQYGGDWLLFRVDLRDAIRRTFGKHGWKLRKLRGFRLRGNLSIAHFAVIGSQNSHGA